MGAIFYGAGVLTVLGIGFMLGLSIGIVIEYRRQLRYKRALEATGFVEGVVYFSDTGPAMRIVSNERYTEMRWFRRPRLST